MDFATAQLVENLLLPPSGPLLLGLLGLLLAFFGKGKRLLILSVLLSYAFSIPVVGNLLIRDLQRHEAVTPQQLKTGGIEALVVMGGGYYGEAEEYGEATVGPFFLERLRYAAWLYRRTGIPVIISSGTSDSHTAAQLLVEELAVPVLAVEDQSWNTWDNARLTTELLNEKAITKVAVVTHGWHMPRALYSFHKSGLSNAVPAPMGLSDPTPDPGDWHQWIPSARALQRTRTALHEYLGLHWYRYGPMIDNWISALRR